MTGLAPRRISLAAVTLRGVPPSQLARAASAAGFDAIGIRVSPWDPSRRPLGPRQLREASALIDSLGLKVNDVEQIRLLDGTLAADFEYVFEAGATLGASYALIYCDDPDDARVIDQLQQLEALGRPYGVSPVLEFMSFTSVNTIDKAARLLVQANLERPTLLIDTLHLARSGGGAGDLKGIDRRWLPFVHLADAPAQPPGSVQGLKDEAGLSRLLPGHGGLPVLDYLRALPSGLVVGLEVPGAAEGTNVERAMAVAHATRQLLAKLDQGPDC